MDRMDSTNASSSVWGEEGVAGNGSQHPEVYIFHQTSVKVPLLLLYTLVFILAFFGEYKHQISSVLVLRQPAAELVG